MRTEEEVNQMVDEMIERTKGKYLTQGVSFNKTCPRQIELLKKALMSSVSFSGLAKEMLALRFDDFPTPKPMHIQQMQGMNHGNIPKNKNIGNFI